MPHDPANRSGATGLLAAAGSGLAGSLAMVVGATVAGSADPVALPAGPAGLWLAGPPGRRGWWVALAIAGIATLMVGFALVYRLVIAGRLGPRGAVAVAGLWWLPVLPGPPLLSLDAYSYTAQGTMLVRGIDPYRNGPSALGDGALLDAIAPVWRDTPAPYGSLAMRSLGRLVRLVDGDQVAALYLLRLVAVAAVVLTVLLVDRMIRGSVAATDGTAPDGTAPDCTARRRSAAVRSATEVRRATAVLLLAANPLVIVHGVGGVHLDLLLGLAAVVVVALAGRAFAARWALPLVPRRVLPLVPRLALPGAARRALPLAGAAAVAAVAFEIKAPGVLLVGYLLLVAAGTGGLWPRLARSGLVVGAVGVVAVGCAAGMANGWGWVGALRVPGRIHHQYEPSVLLAGLVHLVTTPFGSVGFAAALDVTRVVCEAACGIAILAVLVGSAVQWPLGAVAAQGSHGAAAAQGSPAGAAWPIGVGLLLGAVAMPAFYPWYLLWGLAPTVLAAMVTDRDRHQPDLNQPDLNRPDLSQPDLSCGDGSRGHGRVRWPSGPGCVVISMVGLVLAAPGALAATTTGGLAGFGCLLVAGATASFLVDPRMQHRRLMKPVKTPIAR